MFFCGDFNSTLQPAIDSSGSARPESWQWLREQIHVAPRPLTDLFRTLHPHDGGFTRYRGGRHSSEKRLDMVIVSAGANRNFPALTSHVQT